MAAPLKTQGLGIAIGAGAVALIAGIVFVASRPTTPRGLPAGNRPALFYRSLLPDGVPDTTEANKQAQLDDIQRTVDQIRFEQTTHQR